MRIAFLSMGNPHDRRNWSGTPYFAMQEIARRASAFRVIETPRLDRVLAKFTGLSRRLGWDATRNGLILRLYGHSVQRQLRDFAPDAVLAIGGAYKLAKVSGEWPLVFVSDALFCSIVDYYAKFRRLNPATRRRAMALEAQFVRPANRRLSLMSHWAADGAIAAYGVPRERVRVVPIGANLDADPGRGVLSHSVKGLVLLWIGVDWERKGGKALLDAFAELRGRVPDAQLHIVGVSPAEARNLAGVTVHGYLRKSDGGERARLMALFESAFLFVMLSSEEAYGLVYCEAAAFGVPSIGYRTGGVQTIIQDGRTGQLLDTDATAKDVASAIFDLWQDRPRYDAMRIAARDRFETVLNWTAWGDAVMEELAIAAGREGQSS